MRYLLIVSALLLTVKLFASISDPDLQEFKTNFEKEYRILESDSDIRVGGFLVVKTTKNEVGFEFSTFDSSGPIQNNDVKFPLNDSTLVSKNKKYTLEFVGTKQEHYQAIFEALSGYIQINWTKCNDKGCLIGNIKASTGGAPGTKVDAKDFFKEIKKKYAIDYAGSKPPKEPGKEFVVVDIDSDPSEAVVEAPYCLPDGSFCDLGFNVFSYANTEVYRNELSPTEILYTLLIKDTALKVYHWENRSSKIVFRNYQYSLAKKLVCLEHIASK